MEIIRKKRNLENYTVRSIPKSVLIKNSDGKTIIDESNPNYYYGKIPNFKIDKEGNFILNSFGQKIPNTIDINVFLKQDIDDMGLFTDESFTPKNSLLLTEPLGFNSFEYGRLAGAPLNFYFSPVATITGTTDDGLLKQVKSYRKDSNGNDIYVTNLNVSDDPKNIFNGVINDSLTETTYKIGSLVNDIANTGVFYKTFKDEYQKSIDEYGKEISYNKTEFIASNGGWNQFNTSINANTKKEEYLGVVFKPEVKSVVFINRGIADIFERHAILSEIKSTNDIDTNRGGFIRI